MKVFKTLAKLVLAPIAITILTVFAMVLVVSIPSVRMYTRLTRRTVDGMKYNLYVRPAKAFVGFSRELLLGFGGVFVTLQTKEGLRTAMRDKTIPFNQRVIALMAVPGYSVCVVKDLIPVLSKVELDSMIAHEFGHIVKGHLTTTSECGLIYNLQYEMEADDYAASVTSAFALKSALTKLRDMDISRFDESKLADINHRIERLG